VLSNAFFLFRLIDAFGHGVSIPRFLPWHNIPAG
jgi:hypothetical protein